MVFTLPIYLIRMLVLWILFLFPVNMSFCRSHDNSDVFISRISIRKAIAKTPDTQTNESYRYYGKLREDINKGNSCSTLLERKYKTLKTTASKNSPIGIAEMILSDLTP